MAAAAAIAGAGLDTGESYLTLAIFVIIGTIGLAIPIGIYFLGGASDQDHADSSTTTPAQISAAVNVYDVVTNTWSTGPALSAPKMWATPQLLNGRLHVLGGLDATSTEISDHEVLVP